MAYNSAGKNNGASGTARELFQEKAATDVLKYFKVTNVVRPLVTNDSIESGKSKSSQECCIEIGEIITNFGAVSPLYF